jgi:hypothetical protein
LKAVLVLPLLPFGRLGRPVLPVGPPLFLSLPCTTPRQLYAGLQAINRRLISTLNWEGPNAFAPRHWKNLIGTPPSGSLRLRYQSLSSRPPDCATRDSSQVMNSPLEYPIGPIGTRPQQGPNLCLGVVTENCSMPSGSQSSRFPDKHCFCARLTRASLWRFCWRETNLLMSRALDSPIRPQSLTHWQRRKARTLNMSSCWLVLFFGSIL